MDSITRQKIFKVIDGDPKNLRILYEIINFKDHIRIIDWLLRNKVTGEKLQNFYKDCEGNILSMIAYINKKNDHGHFKRKLTVSDLI